MCLTSHRKLTNRSLLSFSVHALHLGSKVVHTKHSVMGVRVGGGGLLKLRSSVTVNVGTIKS